MASNDRPLRREFIERMERNDAWPLTKIFEAWMRSTTGGIRHGVYSNMMKGLPFDPKYAVALAAYLLHVSADDPGGKVATTFAEYMSEIGGARPIDQSPANVADQLLEKDDGDYFRRGPAGIIDAFRSKRIVETYVRGATCEEQVREAVQWLYVWAAEDTAPSRAHHSIDEAIAKTESMIRIPLALFEDLAVNWWRYDAWTVVLAQGKRAPTGMNVTLPLRKEVYLAVRNGERALDEILPSDLCRPSRYLYIVAIAQRPEILGGDEGNTTRNVLAALFSQVSILSRHNGPGEPDPLHVLAAAGTRQNAQRLEATRYKPTKAKTRCQGLPLYERVYDWPMALDDMVIMGFSSMIGAYADRFLQPPMNRKAKQESQLR